MTTAPTDDPLANPAWSALHGPQAGLGLHGAGVARFVPDLSIFAAFDRPPTAAHWAELLGLTGPGREVAVVAPVPWAVSPPDGWTPSFEGVGIQMAAGTGLIRRLAAPGPTDGDDGPPLVDLGSGDVADLLGLVDLARPGPFLPGTVRFDGYVGIRQGGALVAMAGRRMRPPGAVEISAVATHPDHRRRGLAERVVRAVAAGIVADGQLPVLHVAADNHGAVALYRAMGFEERRRLAFLAYRTPV
jgi:ribosomal protein S18 acetylase RimI-like enzyme